MSDQGEQEQPQEYQDNNNENVPNEENQTNEEGTQEVANDQVPNEQEGDNQPQEEPQPEIPQKVYAPPNPTIKECIALNQILPVSQIDNNIDAISTVVYENDDLLNEFLQKVDNRTQICTDDPKGGCIRCEQNRNGES